MGRVRSTVPEILDRLHAFYGSQEACWPSDPYLFLLWWYCGYPSSDASCTKGWNTLTRTTGTTPDAILAARPSTLIVALRPGGMFPELRAERMKEVAARIKNEFDGDLRAALTGPIAKIRKILKSFPSIADPEQTESSCSLESNLWRPCLQTALVCWHVFSWDANPTTTRQATARPSA